MTKSIDQLVDELGDPKPVITDGPADVGDQDQLDQLRVVGKLGKVRTKREAIEWGRQQMVDRVAVYTGMCLMFVRSCFGIAPLYPDAFTAWEMTPPGKRRRCSTDDARRGHAGYFRGGEHGHVVLLLGNGRCLTNDTGAPGTINVAELDAIEAAWGYVFLGDVDQVNGVDCPAPKPYVPTIDRAFRLRQIRLALVQARRAGQWRRAARLRLWRDRLRG